MAPVTRGAHPTPPMGVRFLFIPLVVACATAHGGVVAEYTFDRMDGQVVPDVSGNRHTATLLGPLPTSGVSGSAVQLDGIDDCISVPDHDAFTSMSTMTIEVWFYLQSHGSDIYTTLVSKWGSGSHADDAWGTGFQNSNHSAYFAISSGYTNQILFSRTPVRENEWTQLVGTWDGATARLYINGMLDVSGPWTSRINNEATPIIMGRATEPHRQFFGGKLDEVRILNTALSAQEVSFRYSALRPSAPAQF